MYIPQLLSPTETSLTDTSFLNTLATKKTKHCNIAATTVFLFGFHKFNKNLNTLYGPSTMLNTEDTKKNKSSSCAHFGGRNKTNNFGGRDRSFRSAPIKQPFHRKQSLAPPETATSQWQLKALEYSGSGELTFTQTC